MTDNPRRTVTVARRDDGRWLWELYVGGWPLATGPAAFLTSIDAHRAGQLFSDAVSVSLRAPVVWRHATS